MRQKLRMEKHDLREVSPLNRSHYPERLASSSQSEDTASSPKNKKLRKTVTLLQDLVEDILERLPAKSLVRFKSVARSWNALFKTNSFIRRHSQRQNGSDERLMIVHADPYVTPTHVVTLLSFSHRTLLHLPESQHSFLPYVDHYFVYFYHCNGVICFSINSKITLWNPATREVKAVPAREARVRPAIPKRDVVLPHPILRLMTNRGFGADRNTFDDFKVVQFNVTFHSDNNNDAQPLALVEVYSTRTDSWTVLCDVSANDLTNKLAPFSYNDFVFHDGTYGNGVYHWLSFDCTYILCFEFGSDRFRILDTPTALPSSTIFEAGDSIGFAVQHSVCENEEEEQFEIGFDIWFLAQDSSWTKIYKYNIGPLYYSFPRIYAVRKDGAEFLAGYRFKELVSYNSNGEPLLQFQYLIDMHKYAESIAPLSI
ncbi:F-box protein [Spatholobus suberectus]|nr:F-box protein [Spatholobus suberectus]